MTGKTVGSKLPSGEGYSMFDDLRERFATVAEVKKWLAERYGNCKRQKMYRDSENKSFQAGYIYSFRNEDLSHARSDDNKPWFQQDWVEVKEIDSTPVII